MWCINFMYLCVNKKYFYWSVLHCMGSPFKFDKNYCTNHDRAGSSSILYTYIKLLFLANSIYVKYKVNQNKLLCSVIGRHRVKCAERTARRGGNRCRRHSLPRLFTRRKTSFIMCDVVCRTSNDNYIRY